MLCPRTPVCVLVVLLGVAVGYAAPGDPVGTEFQVNTYTTGGQGNDFNSQSVAQVGTGFVVVWVSGYSIEGQRFDGAGQPIGAEFRVDPDSTGDVSTAGVAQTGSGDFVVVWRNFDTAADPLSHGVQARRYDADGAPVGAQFQVNAYTTSEQEKPVVARLGTTGGFVVAWLSAASAGTDASDTSIQAALFDPSGARASEFQVNSYTTGRQDDPSILALEDGGFVIAWESDGNDGLDTDQECIRLRRFDAAGTPQGAEFQVNTYTTSYQENPSIGVGAFGGFIVAWDSGGSGETDTSAGSVQARRFDGAANPLGTDFQVNSYTTGYQYDSSVAPDGAGGFVVVWNGDNGNGNDDGSGAPYARRFDAVGVPVSDDFQVNTYTTSHQSHPRVAPDGAGGFVAVWTSNGGSGTDTSGSSIQAQRFAGGPTTTSSSSTSTTATTSTTSTTAPGTGTTTTTLQPSGEPLAGRELRLAIKPGHPETSKLALVSGGGLTLGRGNGSDDDPVAHGGALTIASDAGGFSTTLPLDSTWKYVGKAGHGKGYKWNSPKGTIRKVVIKGGRVAITGRGAALGFDLDDDPNPVRIQLVIGAHAYCLEFGGAAPKFKAGKVYRAKGARAPASCP
jgi:hypothetical protein